MAGFKLEGLYFQLRSSHPSASEVGTGKKLLYFYTDGFLYSADENGNTTKIGTGTGSSGALAKGIEEVSAGQQVITIDTGTSYDSDELNPIVSLTVPNSGSTLYITNTTNINSGTFDVILSGTPSTTGYYVNWYIPTASDGVSGNYTLITSNGVDVDTIELSGGIPTSLVPDASGVYDLGSSERPFRDLYLTENSLHLGSNIVSVDNGLLNIDGKNLQTQTDINVKDYGATGDGVTDDTTSIQNAINDASSSGKRVKIPYGTYKISTSLSVPANAKIYGDGNDLTVVNMTTDSPAFRIDDNQVEITDIHVIASGNWNGVGIYANNRNNIYIRRVHVSNHQDNAIELGNAFDCVVESCLFTSSTVDPSAHNHTQAGSDIYVKGNCYRVDSFNNVCKSGSLNGILYQSLLGTSISACKIIGNTVDGSTGYGIACYRKDDAYSVQFSNMTIIGNIVTNTSGETPNASAGRIYGAGIYLLGVDGGTVSSNVIDTCSTHTSVGLLAEAGIGMVWCRDLTISNNIVKNAHWYGFKVNNQNSITGPDVRIKFVGNIAISGGPAPKSGFYTVDCDSIDYVGCEVSGFGNGFHIIKAVNSAVYYHNLIGCTARNCSNHGFWGKGLWHGRFSSCVAEDNASHGFVLESNSRYNSWTDCFATGSIRGFRTTTGGQFTNAVNCRAVNNQTGFLWEAPVVEINCISEINSGSDRYPGSFAVKPRPIDDNGGPSVLYDDFITTSGTTPISSFNDGTLGQKLVLRADHSVTVQHNSSYINLAGEQDFDMTPNDVLSLIYQENDTWLETSRSTDVSSVSGSESSGISGNGAVYSTSETETNDIWIDGKTLYRKVVNLGTLPNSSNTTVAHGIVNSDTFITIRGYAVNGSSYLPLPYENLSVGSIKIQIDGANITIATAANFSLYTGYAILEYTKTS